MTMGTFYAIFGAALAAIGGGVGSAIGVSWACQAAAGVVKEDPDKFKSCMLLMLLPASQAIYGMITAILLFAVKLNMFGTLTKYSTAQGLTLMGLCLPIAIVGFVSALLQAKVCVSGISMVAKRSEASGNAMQMAIMVEIFAIFALIVSLLGILLVRF